MKTVVALYDNMADAQAVVNDLTRAGIDRDDISLVAADREGVYASELGDDTDETMAGEGAAAGAVTGGVLGGIGGVLVGLGLLAIPGIGPVLAAGPIAAGLSGAAIGAVAGGLVGALIGWGIPEDDADYYAEGVRRGGTLLSVRASEGSIDDIVRIMNVHDPVDIERRAVTWRKSGWTKFDETAESHMETDVDFNSDDDDVIEVAEEELVVGKRSSGDTVMVRSYVVEEPVSEDVKLRNERVEVERRAVDRPIHAGDDPFQAKTIAMEEMSEEVIAEKRARVIEEIVLDKQVDYRTETVTDTVRHTEVEIDENGNSDFQKHYDTNFAATGYTYDQYRPAYLYGSRMRTDKRYLDKDWNTVEQTARRDWEKQNEGTWEEFKDAVRHGWQNVKETVS